jgi:hypothetical protein
MRSDDPHEFAGLGVTVAEAPELGAELLARYRSHRPVRGVVVTDLLDPRAAYWRAVAPIPPTDEESARLAEGRRIHEQLGRQLAPATAREVRVRRDGIVGKIDILDGRPLELKSTSNLPSPTEDPRATRPSYLEQLAMYAALVDRADGRLIVVRAVSEGVAAARVWDVEFGSLPAIRAEMVRRADALRHAREVATPEGLPRCAWFDRGCAFQRERACQCSGTEPNLSNVVLEETGRPAARPEVAAEVERLLASRTSGPGEVARFRELAYPRRAYFDGVEAGPGRAAEDAGPAGAPDETWSAVLAVLEDGPAGEYELRHDPSGEPAEAIPTFRGDPILVKSSRSLRPVPADSLVPQRPHYVLELGLRCASLGRPDGWLVLGMERVPSDGDWIRVQRIRFGSERALREFLQRRKEKLSLARRRSDPAGLPTCPTWMVERCPHRLLCGCPAEPSAGRM